MLTNFSFYRVSYDNFPSYFICLYFTNALTAELIDQSLSRTARLSIVRHFYRVMLRNAELYGIVRLSVSDVEVSWPQGLEYFENNSMAE